MRTNLSDLNDHLFATLEALENEELDEAGLEREIKRAEAVSRICTQILHVANTQMSAIKTAESCGLLNKDMPSLLAIKDSASMAEGTAASNEKKRALLRAVQ